MGTKLIDTWAKRLINQKFTWGINDCHQLLYDFLKLQNIDWKDPHNYSSLRGTYNNRREASRVAEEMKPVKAQLEELGYTRRYVSSCNIWANLCMFRCKRFRYQTSSH